MSLFQAEKLIDLACPTTHEEEARTAAVTACRMNRELGFKLTPHRRRRNNLRRRQNNLVRTPLTGSHAQ